MDDNSKKKRGRPKEMGEKYTRILSVIENRSKPGEILGTLTSIKKEYDISSYSNTYRVLNILINRGVIHKEMTVYKYK